MSIQDNFYIDAATRRIEYKSKDIIFTVYDLYHYLRTNYELDSARARLRPGTLLLLLTYKKED